jgi:hypothetical protein
MKYTLTLAALVFGMKAGAQTELLNAAKNDFSALVQVNEKLYQSQDGKAKIFVDTTTLTIRDTGKLVDKTYSYCIAHYKYIGEQTIGELDFQVFVDEAHVVYIHKAVERVMLVVKK